MTGIIRSHIGGLICKAFKTSKNNFGVLNNLKSILTSDFEENNFIFKINEKSVRVLFDVEDGRAVLNIAPDHILQKVNVKHYSDDVCYTFQINNNCFIKEVLNDDKESCNRSLYEDEATIVEYSSPNIAKPFHMGHLRSTVVGQFVANILSYSHPVIRINYLGDWGTQFGLIQAGLKNLSVDIGNLKENPLKIINEAYIHANTDNKLVEEAKEITSNLEKNYDTKELDVWKKLRDLTVNHLEDTYNMLGIQFDEYAWESQYASGFSPILEQMKRNGLIEETNGQMVVSRGQRKFPLMKSDGTSLYLSRDILAALDRYNRHKCKAIKYVIDKSQEDHVDTVRYVVSLLTGKDIIEHVKFGKIVGMSTRKGTSIFLSDILDKATQLMGEQQEKSPNTRNQNIEVTRALAISTLVIYLLKQRRTKDFTFDWDTALQGKGDTGVKLQYNHCRLCSLENNCGIQLPTECHPQIITEVEALQLIAILDKFEQTMVNSQLTLESSHLVNYLFKLCNAISLCLKKLPVKGEDMEIAQQRLLLFHKARLVLKSSMLILGVKPLESM